MNPEAKFWKQMKRSLRVDWIKRVENSVEPGFPDTHYMHKGSGGWIELKAEGSFPSSIKFEPAQPLWLAKYWKAGGSCFVFLKVEDEKKVYVWQGVLAMDLDKPRGCHDVKPMMVFSLTPKGWGDCLGVFNSEGCCP